MLIKLKYFFLNVSYVFICLIVIMCVGVWLTLKACASDPETDAAEQRALLSAGLMKALLQQD